MQALSVLGLFALAIVMACGTTAQAGFPCEAIAIRGDLDPAGDPFSNKFDERVGVNSAGDVVFVGRAGTKQQALYLYEDGGPSTTVAADGQVAPGGATFMRFGKSAFGDVSINTAGDVAFFAKLSVGEGVFIRDGGVLKKIAQTGDASPGGGTFRTFPSVSQVNDTIGVSFVATVDGGPSGLFSYVTASASLAGPIMTTTDVDTDGHSFCEVQEVGYSDGVLAVIATAGIPDCNSPVQTVYFASAPTIVFPLARVGAATPAGGVYTSFENSPETSTTGISFAARVGGSPDTNEGIFFWNGVTTSSVATTGDIAPVVGGLLKKLGGQHQQTLGNEIYARVFLRRSVTGQATFRYGGTPVVAQAKSDIPPNPPFGAGASYRAIGEPAVDESGSFVAFYARVRDAAKPKGKDGILRCTP